MSAEIFRYQFSANVPIEDVQSSLVLALVGAESIHGEVVTQLYAGHFFDSERRVCIVDAQHPAGQAFNALFAGLLRREFGADAFRVRRLESLKGSPTPVAA